MFPAAQGNATYRVGLIDLLVPGSLVAFSLAGFIGAVGGVIHHPDQAAGRGAAGPTGVLAVVFVMASLGLVWAMTKAAPEVAPQGAQEVQAINIAYDPKTLQAPGGKVTVALRNRDLFWHTFTIDRLGVEIRTPVGRLRTATFEARPGTYSFYCRIPGHAALGMRGTLTVR
jgi:plastocyanin